MTPGASPSHLRVALWSLTAARVVGPRHAPSAPSRLGTGGLFLMAVRGARPSAQVLWSSPAQRTGGLGWTGCARLELLCLDEFRSVDLGQ